MKPVAEQMTHLLRGIDTLLPEGGLEERLVEGRPLRVKLGLDPTASDVHLGWAVVLRLLRRFQELGHIAVLIVGDFTAQVGDPSDTSVTRSRLTADEVLEYAEGCLSAVTGLLLPENLELRYNSEWLAGMDMGAVLDLTSKVTVARLLEREDFATRLEAGRPVSLIEFMYPLLQGMDSVAVEADIELGGADQLWNLLVGRELQERHGQNPQLVMTVPLLVGTDGVRKMSQSYENYISVSDPATEMFGKVMSIPDEAMGDYFLLATDVDEGEVRAIAAGLETGDLHPGETKRRLGREIVARYWGSEAAKQAERAFDRVFKDKRAPQEVEEVALPDDDPVWLPGLLRDAGLVKSTSQGKRLLAQRAVKVEGEPVTGEEVGRDELAGRVMQVGKRRFVRLVAS
ncbi:MAG: tyrosine--tRNA ligase [Acidimicrobiia bacterium]